MEKNKQPGFMDPIVIYNTIKNKRKEYLKTHFSGRSKKQPWYMLTKGKCKNYEERTMSWGQCVNNFKVPSETKVMNEKLVVKRMGKAAFMESVVQHKLTKWVRKHPAPCDEKDLFKKEFLDPWKEERDKALERFRDSVVSTYHKLKVYGRYSQHDDGYPKFIGFVKNKTTELFGTNVTHLDTKSVILDRACKIVNIEAKKNKNLIGGRLEDPNGKQGIIIIPKIAA